MTESTRDPTQTTSESTSEEPEGVDPQGSPESQGSSLSPDGQGSGPVVDEETVVVPAEGAEVFQHPLLAGKSPEEIDSLVGTMVDANRSQNSELNRYHAELLEARNQPTAAPAPEVEGSPYGDGFMAEGLSVLEGRVTDKLGTKLEAMIEPLKKDSAERSAGSTREALRGRLKHFNVLETTIDSLLREKNVDPTTADEQMLTSLYYTAVGAATERGINLESVAPAAAPATEERPPVNIQHRPSGAPLPPDTSTERVRPLTEDERILAKEMFPTSQDPEGEYRKYQDLDEGDVVKPGFSAEVWK